MHTGTRLAELEDARVEDRKLRLLALAVLASLALHALILLGLSYVNDDQRLRAAAAPLAARLAKPEPAKVEDVGVPLPAPRPRRVPTARPAPASAATAMPGAEPSKPVEVGAAPAAPAFPAPPAPLPGADPRPAVAASASTSNAPDAALLAKFRLDLLNMARRYENYPRLARENNWTGRVQVRMVIGADGTIASLVVRSSSGHAVLDQEALAKLRAARADTTIPPALLGKVLTLDLSMIFNLTDEER